MRREVHRAVLSVLHLAIHHARILALYTTPASFPLPLMWYSLVVKPLVVMVGYSTGKIVQNQHQRALVHHFLIIVRGDNY
jgi:hypothetical protein